MKPIACLSNDCYGSHSKIERKETAQKQSLCFKLKTAQRYRPRAQYRCNENYVTVKHGRKAVGLRNMDVRRQ